MDVVARYRALQRRWAEKIAAEKLDATLKNFHVYCKDPAEEGAASAFVMLISLAQEGLCEVVQLKGGQIMLSDDRALMHRRLWEKEIVDHIEDSESIWFPLYEQGAFSEMERCSLADTDWALLTNRQQALAVSASLRHVRIPAGTFLMGAQEREEPKGNENPAHQVTLTQGFEMCIYPCTQVLYASIVGRNPSVFKGAMRPVEMVSWCDAVLFCNKLSEREGLTPCYEIPAGLAEASAEVSLKQRAHQNALSARVRWNRAADGYRLPTEAEWEYAAKAGQRTIYAGSDSLVEVGWFDENSGYQTQAVGEKKPNAFGLYDLSGNVHEWVWDFFDPSAYGRGACTDPIVDDVQYNRSNRGGCFFDFAWHVRICYRHNDIASDRTHVRGFRLVRFCVE